MSDRNVTVMLDDGRTGDIPAADTPSTPDGPLALVSEVEILAAGYDVPGAVHHWTFDVDGSDSGTGTHHTFAVFGFVTPSPAPTKFVNPNAVLDACGGTGSVIGSLFSASFWFKFGSSPSSTTLFTLNGINFTYVALGGGIYKFEAEESGIILSSNSGIPTDDNLYHHIVVMYDGERGWFFVDGVFQGTDIGSLPPTGTAFDKTGNSYLIDDLRIYDRLLTSPRDILTQQGNTFNGNSQLVRTTPAGKLPILDGSNLTSISPLAAKGDLWAYSTVNDNFPVGADGKVIVADSTKTFGLDYVFVTVDDYAPTSTFQSTGGLGSTVKGTPLYKDAGSQISGAKNNGSLIEATVVGLALASVGNGQPVTFRMYGPMTLTTSEWDAVVTGGSGGLVAGTFYWLDGVGKLTPTIPTGANYRTLVGIALTTTVMYVKNDSPHLYPGAGGDLVSGPGSAVDSNVAVFDGATGKLIKDSGLFASGSGIYSNSTAAHAFFEFIRNSANQHEARAQGRDNAGTDYQHQTYWQGQAISIRALAGGAYVVPTIIISTAGNAVGATAQSGTYSGLVFTSGFLTGGALDLTGYVGGSGITTLGTISSGTWNGTIVGLPYGGTGANLNATGPGLAVQASNGAVFTITAFTSSADYLRGDGSFVSLRAASDVFTPGGETWAGSPPATEEDAIRRLCAAFNGLTVNP